MTCPDDADVDIFQPKPDAPKPTERVIEKHDVIFKDPSDGRYVCGMVCPNQVLGLLCGKEQRELRELSRRYPGLHVEMLRGARLNHETVYEADFDVWLSTRLTTVVIVHESESVLEQVFDEVKTRITHISRSAPYTHFISLPITREENEQLCNTIDQWCQSVLSQNDTQATHIEPSIMVPTGQLHFTLMMLRVYDRETVEKLSYVLECLVGVIKERQIAKFPMRVTLKGTYIFPDERAGRACTVYTHAGVSSYNLATAKENAEALTSEDQPEKPFETDAEARRFAGRDLAIILKSHQTMQQRLSRSLPALAKACADVSALQELYDKGPKLEQALKSLQLELKTKFEDKPANPTRRRRGNERTTFSVEGPEVSRIFEIFEILVSLMTREGLLSDEGKRERRITESGATREDGTPRLEKTSLVLHLTLMNAKWRKRESHRRHASRHTTPFDASAVLDPNLEFGTAVLSQIHLARCGWHPQNKQYRPEKVFSL